MPISELLLRAQIDVSAGRRMALEIGGFGLLGAAIVAASSALSPQAASALGEHLVTCLTGAKGPANDTWTAFGHCAACYAVAALSALGGLALAVARQR